MKRYFPGYIDDLDDGDKEGSPDSEQHSEERKRNAEEGGRVNRYLDQLKTEKSLMN